eukprot:GILJ01010425.1.p1 GENE.GILJ01010425.1~~GILJ01010425.1.p1  ORF type:complete len:309 (+),score=54.54 GILJ01010425.1:29-955(+)
MKRRRESEYGFNAPKFCDLLDDSVQEDASWFEVAHKDHEPVDTTAEKRPVGSTITGKKKSLDKPNDGVSSYSSRSTDIVATSTTPSKILRQKTFSPARVPRTQKASREESNINSSPPRRQKSAKVAVVEKSSISGKPAAAKSRTTATAIGHDNTETVGSVSARTRSQMKTCPAKTTQKKPSSTTSITATTSGTSTSLTTGSIKTAKSSIVQPAATSTSSAAQNADGVKKRKRETDMDDEELFAMLAAHNQKFKPKAKYEPRKFSVKDVKQWELDSGKSWYTLSPEEREVANKEIEALSQKGATAGGRS